MYEQLQSLDNVAINFGTSEMWVANFILAFIMFGVALGIKISDFKEILKKPKPLIVGLSAQIIALPAVTFCLVSVFHQFIPPGVAMGMILVSACPGGNISNYISSLSRANVALSVSLTSVTTVVAVIFTPLNFKIWGTFYVNFMNRNAANMLQPITIDFWQMLYTLTFLIIIPLTFGMALSHFFPKFRRKIEKPVQIISLLLFVGILVGALIANLEHFKNNLFYIFIIVLLHNLTLILLGYGWARLFGLSKINCRTISVETGIQNSGIGLGLLLNKKIFPIGTVTGGMIFLVAWWCVWDLIPGLIIAAIYRYFKIKNPDDKVFKERTAKMS